MQIQDNRILLQKASQIISQKADGFIGQAIEKILQDWKLGTIQSEDGGLGRGPQGASAGEKRASVFEYPDLTRYAHQVAGRMLRY